MAGYTVKEHVNAPPETVFAAASDFARAPGRIKGIKKVEMLTQGPVGPGTRFKETRIMFGKEATETMEVTAFDPPRILELGCQSCGCEYRTTFRFTPAQGGTDVDMNFEAKPLTFMAKVLGFLFAPMVKACVKETKKDLADLKTHCEGDEKAATA